MYRALIVVNPAARRVPTRAALAAAVRDARALGWRVALATTAGPGDATAIARQAAGQGCAAVFACGGDGTLNEVANGLLGTDAALGFIPAGTVNIWAKEHGIPAGPAAALRLLSEGVTRMVDVGWAEHAPLEPHPPAPSPSATDGEGVAAAGGEVARAFLLMAGLGFDSAVTRAVGKREKRVAGPLAFARATLTSAITYRAARATLRYDGVAREANLALLIASNSRLYAGIFRPAPHALIDDGLLDITLVDAARVLPDGLAALPRLLLGRVPPEAEGRGVSGFRTAALSIETRELAILQLDGEIVGRTPVRLTVRPRALRVVVPPGPNPLYREPPGPPLGED